MVLFLVPQQECIVMRSTIILDDALVDKARSLSTKETAALIRQALETLVRVESDDVRLIATSCPVGRRLN